MFLGQESWAAKCKKIKIKIIKMKKPKKHYNEVPKQNSNHIMKDLKAWPVASKACVVDWLCCLGQICSSLFAPVFSCIKWKWRQQYLSLTVLWELHDLMFVSCLEQHHSWAGTNMGWLLLLYWEVEGKDRTTHALRVGEWIHLFYVGVIFQSP